MNKRTRTVALVLVFVMVIALLSSVVLPYIL
jgi:hypothetical protein